MKRLNRKASKPFALVAAVLLIATIGTGTTLAWLATKSNEAVNTFVPGTVTATIVEDFNGNTKNNVQVKNEGNLDVYVRVALVPTWQDQNGNILAESATVAQNLQFTLNTGAWLESDGYYYHKAKVTPGETTEILANTITPIHAPTGAKMNLQVLAEAIQATQQAVDDAWGNTIWPSLTH